MRKRTILYCLLLLQITNPAFAQVSPYQIPPKWMFGYGAGFDFGTSPFTISPPNVLTGDPTNNEWGSGTNAVGCMEASTAACDPTSNLVFYTNCFRMYDYPANTSFAFPGGTFRNG